MLFDTNGNVLLLRKLQKQVDTKWLPGKFAQASDVLPERNWRIQSSGENPEATSITDGGG